MMRNPKTLRSALLATVTTVFFATSSFASVNQAGTITQIAPEASNVVSVWLTGTTPTSECPSAGGRWTIQKDDPLFDIKIAVLMTAATRGKAVTLASTGTCGQWNSNVIYLVIATY